MDTLTPRQRQILTLVIESYISTPLPVGSKSVAGHKGLDLSPASVRNEMGILEQLGYLTHPHTSAGRVPTDSGYQFYVRKVVKEEPLPRELIHFISQELARRIENLESLMERASQILSAMAEEAVLVSAPQLMELYLKQLSLIPMDETQLLVVWCTTSGLVQNCLAKMDRPISSEEVEKIRRFINQELVGESIETLQERLLEKIESRRDSLRRIYELTLHIIQASLPHWAIPRVFIEGSRYVLNQPEFQDLKKFQLLIATLEEKSNLINILTSHSKETGVHIAIGEKELSKDIWDCSLVSASYRWKGKRLGAVGVLGPRRMRYGRIISLVHQVADEISQNLERWGS